MKFAPIIKYKFWGDKDAAQTLRGKGLKLVPMLQNLSSFNGLRQNAITKRFHENVVINVSHCYNIYTINIWVREERRYEPEKREDEPYFLFFAQSYFDSSCWGFDLDFQWVRIADAPVKDSPWLFLGCASIDDKHRTFAMSFNPFVVWWLREPYWSKDSESWEIKKAAWVDHNVPDCDYGEPLHAYNFSNQPVWTGESENKFFIRLYFEDNYYYRDVLSLDIATKSWALHSGFQDSGCKVLTGTGQYYNSSWPTWDGERQVSWWYELGGAPYWSKLYHTGVGYAGDYMPHDGNIQSLKKPSRLLTIGVPDKVVVIDDNKIDYKIFICITNHEALSNTEPDVGEDWETYWEVDEDEEEDPGRVWGNGVGYASGDKIIIDEESIYFKYECLASHNSNPSNQPGTVSGELYWTKKGRIGPEWLFEEIYYRNRQFFCGDPDFGSEYASYPIVQNVLERDYEIIRAGPGFHWGQECCYTGSHILTRNPTDYSVWAFNDSGWAEVSDAPERETTKSERAEGAEDTEPFDWFDCCYAGGTPKPYAGDIIWE